MIGPCLDRISAAMNSLVLAELDVEPGEAVLEVGFGGGGLIAALIEAGVRPLGADISEAMVARARRRFGAKARIERASVEALPFGTGEADRAASVNNIYFWPDAPAGMAELARVIRPGGMLAIAFEPPEELAKWPGHKYGFRLWSEAEVSDLMEAAGFERLRTVWGTGRKPDRFLCLTGVRRAAGRGDG